MLLVLLLLFQGLLCPGERTADPQALGPPHLAAEEPLTFRLLQISSFANHSWVQNQASGWLGELQTHGWDSVLGAIRFLRPWSQGNFSKEELKNLQALFQLYFHGFIHEVQAFASQFQFEYPFELQISSGCRMSDGEASESFLKGAYQGTDFLSFQGNSWQPSPGAGSRAQNVCRVLNRYRDIKEIVQGLLSGTCPRFLASIPEAGKAELERQVKPEAWVSKGPTRGPGRLMLVCHVSGFHPKTVGVMWMRGEQMQLGTRQDGYSRLLILIGLTVTVILVMLIVLEFWFKKQSSSCNSLSRHVPDPAIGANTQDARGSGHQLCSALESWAKYRFLKKWKTRLSQL
nr:T-cell surface glycoprotein CD1e, membrane-associated-like isoform X3 [Loxodonta africana]